MAFEKIGEYLVRIPDAPEPHLIAGFDLPQEEQMWRRSELPGDPSRDMDWDELREEEILKSSRYLDRYNQPTDVQSLKLNPEFIDEGWVNSICEDFRRQEWTRRINGYWFYNNGKATYLTGLHYFYLNWWKIDIGYPVYRNVDRKFFVLWKNCEEDPDCFGLIEITRRRQGKSWRASVIAYEYASRTYNAHIGMQSKERSAAMDWFTEKIIGPWKELPHFFKPTSNSGTDPVQSLSFKSDSKKGVSGRAKAREKELRTKITWGPSVKTHYDGQKLHRVVFDEIGKTVEENVSDRHDIVKKCCEIEGGKIIGKMYETTTVEEMEKGGGKNCKIVWDKSDPKKLFNGRTVSGLKRLFTPASEGYIVDKYGDDLIEESLRIINAERDSLKGDSRGLAALKRKMPLTIEEAFRADGSKSHFDVDKIQNRLDYLTTLERPLYQVGNLEWKNKQKDSEVYFDKRNSTGKFKITFLPEQEVRNNVMRVDGKPVRPLNKLKYIMGCDPFDHEKTNTGIFSNAAAYVFLKFDPLVDGGEREVIKWKTNRFVVEYIARPKPFEFYEDMIKICVFFGCEMLVETQKIGIVNHFKARGYKNFLMRRPESVQTTGTKKQTEYGLPASELVHEAIVDRTDSYISEDIFGSGNEDGYEHGYIDLVDFPRLCEDWIDFDIEDTQKYDSTMGAGYTLIAATKSIKKQKDKLDVKQYFVEYQNNGLVSQEIEPRERREADECYDEVDEFGFSLEDDTYEHDKYISGR